MFLCTILFAVSGMWLFPYNIQPGFSFSKWLRFLGKKRIMCEIVVTDMISKGNKSKLHFYRVFWFACGETFRLFIKKIKLILLFKIVCGLFKIVCPR